MEANDHTPTGQPWGGSISHNFDTSSQQNDSKHVDTQHQVKPSDSQSVIPKSSLDWVMRSFPQFEVNPHARAQIPSPLVPVGKYHHFTSASPRAARHPHCHYANLVSGRPLRFVLLYRFTPHDVSHAVVNSACHGTATTVRILRRPPFLPLLKRPPFSKSYL